MRKSGPFLSKHEMPQYPARRNPFLVYQFRFYAEAILRRQFYSLRVKNAQAFHLRDPGQATLCISNHCNWWDGLADYLMVTHLAPASRYYVMIEELYRFPLLAYLGAFSIEKTSPRTSLKALAYAADLLNEDPRNLLWIYPQGVVAPQEIRPLRFAQGVAYLLKQLPEINLMPVAKYYTFLSEDRPEILMEVGNPIQLTPAMLSDREGVTALLESTVTALLEDIRASLLASDLTAFTTVIQGELNPFKQVEASLRTSWQTLGALLRPIEFAFNLEPRKNLHSLEGQGRFGLNQKEQP